jgi:hypothetical protein
MLPFINTSAGPIEISQWKSSSNVLNCYRKLFSPIDKSNPDVTYMSRILERIWNDVDKAPLLHIAYAISTCETVLNPKVEGISISEKIIKERTKVNLVNFFFNFT